MASNFDTTWAALDPGDDWAAQVIQSIFPVSSGSAPLQIGTVQTVIGTMLGHLAGFALCLAAAFVCYGIILQIHRAAESGRVLSETTSSWWPVRTTLAVAMMFPLGTGFSAGQAGVVKVSLWGIGMARSLYQGTIQAIGPDAMPIAQPMIPGTKTVVAGLIQSEMCRALINAASGQPNMVPAPSPVTGTPVSGAGGYVTWSYSLAAGNETAPPVCGTVTIREPLQGATNLGGVSVDMAGIQMAILSSVVAEIRPVAESVARSLWRTRQSSSLDPLMMLLTSASANYTAQLTQAATRITQSLRSSLQAADARTGSIGLQQNQTRLQALGWTGAGAYYLEIARLNGTTLSLLSATPVLNAPSYLGLGQGLASDIAPLQAAVLTFSDRIMTYAETADGMEVAGGNADLFSGATPGEDGAGAIEQLVRKLHISERVLNAFLSAVAPTGLRWADPFAALIDLGQKMVLIAVTALGAAGLLASTTGSAATAAVNVLTLNFAGAAATVIGHLMMNFVAVPIFLGCMALLVPGLLIAFVLPMIPFAIWIAGVAGYFITVCEAVVALPMWMFAVLSFQGDGLHGRGIDGVALLANLIFRPVLMLFGLMLGYVIFAAMSWLVMQSFGIAAGFVFAGGWLVANLLGVVVLLCLFVLLEVTIALLSFRMISLVPHHAIQLMAIKPANRVDMDRFAQDVGLVGMAG